MQVFLGSLLRALLYCFYPRILGLTLLPVLFLGGAAVAVAYFFGEQGLDFTRAWLQSYGVYQTLTQWLNTAGWSSVVDIFPALVLILILGPLVVLITLLFVETLITPAANQFVAYNRFPALTRKQTSWFASMGWMLSSYTVALVFLLLSIPLWLIPPLSIVLPAVIWGWLIYRTMAFDALSDFATASERKALIAQQRPWLVAIGISAGFLSTLPSLFSVFGVFFAVFFIFFIPLSIWLYTMTFTFTTLWFSHFCLQKLQQMQQQEAQKPVDVEALVYSEAGAVQEDTTQAARIVNQPSDATDDLRKQEQNPPNSPSPPSISF